MYGSDARLAHQQPTQRTERLFTSNFKSAAPQGPSLPNRTDLQLPMHRRSQAVAWHLFPASFLNLILILILISLANSEGAAMLIGFTFRKEQFPSVKSV